MTDTSVTPACRKSRLVIAESIPSRWMRERAYTITMSTSRAFLIRAIISWNRGRPATVIAERPGSTYSSTISAPISAALR
nr:hypothetical protein [Stackebrandtia nassauensis]